MGRPDKLDRCMILVRKVREVEEGLENVGKISLRKPWQEGALIWKKREFPFKTEESG